MITLPHCHHHTTQKTGARYQMFRQEIDSKSTSSGNKRMIQVMDGLQKLCMFHIELSLNISLLCKCPKLTLSIISLTDSFG